jgi:hypothetical protein
MFPFSDSPVYSHIGGFAERLPNWNTLITETTTGRIFEVNREGQIVWEYVNPLPNVDSVFRFAPNDVDWPEKLPPPDQEEIPDWILVIVASIVGFGILYYM